MSGAACVEHCQQLGYIFAATQYSDQCFCDNNYGALGEADNCNMPCAENPSEICGGTWANSVYHVGRERGGKPLIRPETNGAFADLMGKWQCRQEDAFITGIANINIQQDRVSVQAKNHMMIPGRVIEEELSITSSEYNPYRQVQSIVGSSKENGGAWVVRGTFREPGRNVNIVSDYWYIRSVEGDPGKIVIFVSGMGGDWEINCIAERI